MEGSAETVHIPIIAKTQGLIAPDKIKGEFVVPLHAKALIVFAHGGGSDLTSPRNKLVATVLNDAGFATLLLDMLGPQEAAKDRVTFEYRFNIRLLSSRLLDALDWISHNGKLELRIGLFGSSTGAAAAIVAANLSRSRIYSIVSRGGRPDLVSPDLLRTIQIPTVFVIGSKDRSVIESTKSIVKELRAMREKQVVVIQGAGHLFEEPGSLEKVASISVDWFIRHLS